MDKTEWMPADGIELEDAADKAVRCKTNALIVAGPGAGKTEMLAQKAGYLFNTNTCPYPKKILAISFKNDAAKALKDRVVKRYGEEYKGRFISLTYDAFFKNMIDRFYRALPEQYIPDPDYGMLIKEKEVKSWINCVISPQFDSYTNAYFEQLKSVPLPIKDNIELEKLWQTALKGNDVLSASLSFSMISRLTLLLFQTNIYIKRILRSTYSHVFLDEFQDTTTVQYEIIKELFGDSNVRITAVGDNKQRIMLWAGALKTVFNDFNADFAPMEFSLVMNHRSAPRLVELQKDMYSLLKEPAKNITCSQKWNPSDGEINLVISDNEKTEARRLASTIKEDISSGIKANDICIISKQLVDMYSNEIINELHNYNIRARVENDYQDLIKDELILILLDVFKLSQGNRNAEAWDDLVSFCLNIFPQMTNNNEGYVSKLIDINHLLQEVKIKSLSLKTISDLLDCINYTLAFFGIDQIKAFFPAYQQGKHLSDNINLFSKLLWNEWMLANGSWINAIDGFLGEDSMPIMTIHKSKGLEYSSVYFVGLEDSAFWTFEKQPEEDRCAFFVALSRAKQKITFTYCDVRTNQKYKLQKHDKINEFFELLMKPGVANIFKEPSIYASQDQLE